MNHNKIELKNTFKIFSTVREKMKGNRYISKKPKKFQIAINSKRKKQVKFLNKKLPYFKKKNFSNKKQKNSKNPHLKGGRWTKDERMNFLLGISLYGNKWKKINPLIKTRAAIQIKSHAQKFFIKMKTCKDEELGIDFTLETINSLKDMINQIRGINPNFNIINVFQFLSDKCDRKRKFKAANKLKNKEVVINEGELSQNVIEDKINYLYNNSTLNEININENINNFEKTKEKNESRDNEHKNSTTNFLNSNDVKYNNINVVNNNININIINEKNTFLNINNNFQNTLNNLIQLNKFYNDFLMTNYINYYNNDGILLRNLLVNNNNNFPFINILSTINLFNSLGNQKLKDTSMKDNSINDGKLKELNNKNGTNTLLNKNNNISNDDEEIIIQIEMQSDEKNN